MIQRRRSRQTNNVVVSFFVFFKTPGGFHLFTGVFLCTIKVLIINVIRKFIGYFILLFLIFFPTFFRRETERRTKNKSGMDAGKNSAATRGSASQCKQPLP
jgi:hypothetical protein